MNISNHIDKTKRNTDNTGDIFKIKVIKKQKVKKNKNF